MARAFWLGIGVIFVVPLISFHVTVLVIAILVDVYVRFLVPWVPVIAGLVLAVFVGVMDGSAQDSDAQDGSQGARGVVAVSARRSAGGAQGCDGDSRGCDEFDKGTVHVRVSCECGVVHSLGADVRNLGPSPPVQQ